MVKLGGGADPSAAPAPSANFDPGSKNRVDAVGFNPLLQFDHIGTRKLDQVGPVGVWLYCKSVFEIPDEMAPGF